MDRAHGRKKRTPQKEEEEENQNKAVKSTGHKKSRKKRRRPPGKEENNGRGQKRKRETRNSAREDGEEKRLLLLDLCAEMLCAALEWTACGDLLRCRLVSREVKALAEKAWPVQNPLSALLTASGVLGDFTPWRAMFERVRTELSGWHAFAVLRGLTKWHKAVAAGDSRVFVVHAGGERGAVARVSRYNAFQSEVLPLRVFSRFDDPLLWARPGTEGPDGGGEAGDGDALKAVLRPVGERFRMLQLVEPATGLAPEWVYMRFLDAHYLDLCTVSSMVVPTHRQEIKNCGSRYKQGRNSNAEGSTPDGVAITETPGTVRLDVATTPMHTESELSGVLWLRGTSPRSDDADARRATRWYPACGAPAIRDVHVCVLPSGVDAELLHECIRVHGRSLAIGQRTVDSATLIAYVQCDRPIAVRLVSNGSVKAPLRIALVRSSGRPLASSAGYLLERPQPGYLPPDLLADQVAERITRVLDDIDVTAARSVRLEWLREQDLSGRENGRRPRRPRRPPDEDPPAERVEAYLAELPEFREAQRLLRKCERLLAPARASRRGASLATSDRSSVDGGSPDRIAPSPDDKSEEIGDDPPSNPSHGGL